MESKQRQEEKRPWQVRTDQKLTPTHPHRRWARAAQNIPHRTSNSTSNSNNNQARREELPSLEDLLNLQRRKIENSYDLSLLNLAT